MSMDFTYISRISPTAWTIHLLFDIYYEMESATNFFDGDGQYYAS